MSWTSCGLNGSRVCDAADAADATDAADAADAALLMMAVSDNVFFVAAVTDMSPQRR